tara:strand:- start:822 stop:1214 length:393 start_codon:yes stop_codon:yes gene_type:complete
MGGSAKQVRDKVAKETGYTGSDLDKGAQHVGKKGAEVAEGFKEHGGAIATGIGKMGQQLGEGLDHNLKQLKGGLDMIFAPGGGGGEEGEQEATANYSGSSKKGKAAGSAEGRMGKNRERLAKRDALKVRK